MESKLTWTWGLKQSSKYNWPWAYRSQLPAGGSFLSTLPSPRWPPPDWTAPPSETEDWFQYHTSTGAHSAIQVLFRCNSYYCCSIYQLLQYMESNCRLKLGATILTWKSLATLTVISRSAWNCFHSSASDMRRVRSAVSWHSRSDIRPCNTFTTNRNNAEKKTPMVS